MKRTTIRTMRSLANAELRGCKLALKECTDLKKRKTLVARIETLRDCLTDINLFAYDARLTRNAELDAFEVDEALVESNRRMR